jgi:hypothetical protein
VPEWNVLLVGRSQHGIERDINAPPLAQMRQFGEALANLRQYDTSTATLLDTPKPPRYMPGPTRFFERLGT